MGNSDSKENTSVNYDKKNCVDSGVWNDTGCEGIMEAGEDVTEIKKCKIDCLNHWINKLENKKKKIGIKCK